MDLKVLFFRNRRFIISLGIIGIMVLCSLTIAMALQNSSKDSSASEPAVFSENYQVGVWSWKSPDTYTTSEMQAQAEALQKDRVKTVYTDISSYADYTEIRDPTQKQKKINTLTAALRQFVSTFQDHGIAVHALAGNTDWGSQDYWHLPKAISAYVTAYNAGVAQNEQLAGLQFDIEYYNHETYEDDKNTNNSEYLGLTNALIAQQLQQNSTFPLGFTAPYWFDNENGHAPSVNFMDVTKTPMQHLVDQLNILPNGYITVMAYRNTAKGNDGVIKHAQQEIDYASEKAHTKVYVGLETTDVQPEKITFHDQPKSDIIKAISQIHKEFSAKPAFNGFTINDSDGLLQL
jgi:hypothetical protein